MMKWKYVKPLENAQSIGDFEKETEFLFPEDFGAFILEHNGGRPDARGFRVGAVDRELKGFLSFNRGDKETVWNAGLMGSTELAKKYIAVAIDNFGNLVCFDRAGKIIFYDNEARTVKIVADTFTEFMELLHK